MLNNMLILCSSHSQPHYTPNRKEKEGMPARSNVCRTDFSSKANWGSPVKLLELFPNANTCYQINKATKDANREICAARLASVGRKRKWNISIKTLPRAFSAESETPICMFLFEDSVFACLRKESGPRSVAWEYTSNWSGLLFAGLASHRVCSV